MPNCHAMKYLSKGFILFLILSMISVNFCILTPLSYASDPIHIGVSLGLSGQFQKMALAQKNGFLLWEHRVNARGGILGRKVRVHIHDDQSKPDIAKKIYTKMIEEDRVDLVFAPFSSVITEAILPITEKHRYCVLASGAAADRLWNQGHKYIFGMFTPASRIAVTFLEMLALHDIKKIAIVFADDAFSSDIATGTKKWAERFGLEVILHMNIGRSSLSLKEILLKAEGVGTEALILGGHLNDAIAVRKEMDRIGWYPKAFYTPQGPGVPAYRESLRGASEYTFSSSQWELLSGIVNPGSESFIKAYEDMYASTPPYFAATAYAAGQILEAAIIKSGGLDREKIREALTSLHVSNIIGRFGVDNRGMQLKYFTLVVQMLNGKREVVWPTNVTDIRPVFR